MKKITVGVADDHPIVVLGVLHLLQSSPDIEVIFTTERIEDLLRLLVERPVDVLLCDYEFKDDPHADGLRLLQDARGVAPNTRIIVFSSHVSPYLVSSAMEAGASGFIGKKYSDFANLAYQVFDKGYMEDGDGRYIDFRNTTILLTSNVGSELTATLCADESLMPDLEALREALSPELLKVFPAAFLGRVSVVPYRPLASASLAMIVGLHLKRITARMAENHGVSLNYTQAVVDYIVQRCQVQETGARVLIGFIEQHLLPPLARLWLDTVAVRSALTSIEIDVVNAEAQPQQAFVFRTASVDSTSGLEKEGGTHSAEVAMDLE